MATPGFGGYVRTPEQVIVHDAPLRATERGRWKARWRVRGRVQEQEGIYTAEWHHSEVGWLITAETYTT